MNTADTPKDIPTDPAHRWEWIKFQLRVRGTSLAKIARDLEVSGPAVKNAKSLPYPRVERAIALSLGLQPAEIWPERWDACGEPARRRPRSAERRSDSSQKHNAAYDLQHVKTGSQG
jgi:Ner family transcriptional regulator